MSDLNLSDHHNLEILLSAVRALLTRAVDYTPVSEPERQQLLGLEAQILARLAAPDINTTIARAIAQDIHLGRSSHAIQDEIIAKVGMMADARTPEMKARYGAAVARESAPGNVPASRLQRTVTCAWCSNRYRSAIPDNLDRGFQGSHCASDVVREGEDWIVRGGYGSDEHDMHRYKFVANLPTAPADPVCDECISERWQAGDLVDIGLHCDRRPTDFGPRPHGTWGLVDQIRRLVENEVAMRRLIAGACQEHDTVHALEDPKRDCNVCAEIKEYRRHQRWNGELDDDGPQYAKSCPEVAAKMRDAAHRLEELAAFWERERSIDAALEVEDPPTEAQ